MFNTAIVIRSLKLLYSVRESGNPRVRLQVDAVGSALGSSSVIKRIHGGIGKPIGGTFEAPIANAKICPGSTPCSKVRYVEQLSNIHKYTCTFHFKKIISPVQNNQFFLLPSITPSW